MLKRIKWKRVFFLLSWVTALAGLAVLMSFIAESKKTVVCTDVRVLIPGTSSFIDRKEINRIVDESIGKLKGVKIETINLHHIETVLKANPYIRDVRVFADMDGVMHIEIAQRDPVLRIYNAANQDFYVDRDGVKIPASHSYTPHVMVANGFIAEGFSGKTDTLKTQLVKDIYKAAIFFETDSLWNEQIEQIYVNPQKELELIPRVGNQRILLGGVDSLALKMNNLRIFYKEVIPSVGWDAYKTISIKYSNQIVCERNSDTLKVSAPVIRPIERKEINNTAKKVKP